MASPLDKIRRANALEGALSRTNPGDRVLIQQAALQSQVRVKTEVYYSAVRLTPQSVSKVAGTTTVTFSPNVANPPQAFSYGVGDQMVNAGFPVAAPSATYAQTNLIAKNETNEQEEFLIDGLAFISHPGNDAELVRKVLPELYLSAGFGGDKNKFKFGPGLFWPGGAGIFGNGASFWGPPPMLQDAKYTHPGSPSNGSPFVNNYRRLPEGIRWNPKGQPDSTFGVNVTLTKAITFTGADRAADVANNIAAVTVPSADGDDTGLLFWVALYGIQKGVRGTNA